MGKIEKIYASAPVWSQNAMVSMYGLYWYWARFGSGYRQYQKAFLEREVFSKTDWDHYQKNEVRKLLMTCLSHVPYYRDSWSEELKSAIKYGSLSDLPILEKNHLRQEPLTFIRQDQHPWYRPKFHTSGTTGTPITTYFTLGELRKSMALREVRSANWAGVSFKEPRATFSGRLVEPRPDRNDYVYRYNAAEKQVYFSAFHLKPSTAQKYVDALHRYRVSWLTGYAVSYYILAKYILDQNILVPPIKAIITTSEKLTLEMRSVIESAFNCKVFEEYSTVENALFANDCEQGRLHMSPDASIIEILRQDGTPCDPGEVGEVITTCLLRDYQPLIRFRLGDLAAWDSDPCPCGRQMPVLKEIVGRIEDIVTGPDGRQLVRFHGIFADQPNIIEGQIIQEDLSNFVVKVVPTEHFNDSDIVDIKDRMYQRLGKEVSVKVILVNEISRSKSGKVQAVISKVK